MTTPPEKPLPCPFCGSDNIEHYEVEGRDNHSFECLECLAGSMCKSTRVEALAAWNRRAQPAGLSAALLSELRGYLTAAADGSMSRNNSEAMASELLEQMAKELCSAPPPQAVLEPLTEDQRSDIATAAAGFNWASDYVEAIDYVIDGVEQLHGITKGGQHGADA